MKKIVFAGCCDFLRRTGMSFQSPAPKGSQTAAIGTKFLDRTEEAMVGFSMPDIVTAILVVGCALGFAAGYGVREYMSRQRHRRYHARRGY